ncbi:MAG TPA: glycosyltransferase family 39 protein, partial [Leptolinea sp.]
MNINYLLQKYRNTILVWIGAILIAILHIWSLMRYPEVHVDEAWLISRAWAYIQTGHQFGPLDFGLVDKFKDYWIVNEWLITVLQAAVLRLSKVPDLYLVRSLSLLLGFGLLGINFIIGKKLGGQSLAVVSTLFLALSRAFFYTAHMARYEIFAVLFAYAALAVVICDPGRRFWSGILAGILIGLAVETHLNSLIFIPALGVIYLLDDGWGFLRKPGIWGLAVGLLIGAGYYLALHVLPDPNTFLSVNVLIFGKAYTPPLLTLNPDKILNGFSEAGMLLL